MHREVLIQLQDFGIQMNLGLQKKLYIYVESQIVAQTQVEKGDGLNKPNIINL